MTIPQGLLGSSKGQVCKLQKSLYGLKQTLREWNAEFSRFLNSIGFTTSPFDPCLFTKGPSSSFLALLVYINDVIIASSSIKFIDDLKSALDTTFTVKSWDQLNISSIRR